MIQVQLKLTFPDGDIQTITDDYTLVQVSKLVTMLTEMKNVNRQRGSHRRSESKNCDNRTAPSRADGVKVGQVSDNRNNSR